MTSSTPESKQSLGQFLRQERERKGITIEQVASATKIGVRTLHSLEADQYADLPAKPFVRGFVISYSRFIGIDYKEVLTRFNDYLEEKVEKERPNREAGHSGYVFERRDGEQQSRTILAMVLGVFVVLGAVAAVFFKPHHHHHGSAMERLQMAHVKPSAAAPLVSAATGPSGPGPETSLRAGGPSVAPASVSSPEASPSPSVEGHAPPAPAEPAASPSPLASGSVEGAGGWPPQAQPPDPGDPLNSGKTLSPGEIRHRLVVKCGNSVWIRYRVDGKPVMQFPLKKDKVLVLRARDFVVFQTSNPEDIKVSYNNEGYHPMQDDKNTVTRHNDATLFYPHQLAETVQEPFPHTDSLSQRPAPLSRSVQPLSTPTP